MSQNATLVKSIKRYFKWCNSPKNSFPASWPPKITTWLNSIKLVSTQPATGLSAFWQTQKSDFDDN
jgi:hypothetical protein